MSVVSVVMGTPFRLAQLARSHELPGLILDAGAGVTIGCLPHSRRMVFARWTVATERQGGFSPAEGPSPDASVT